MVKPNTPEVFGFTEYSLLRESCGLSHEDCAEAFDITVHQSRNFETGRRRLPSKVRYKMRGAFLDVDRTAALGREPKGAMRRGIARRTLERQIKKDAQNADSWMG